jgi:hypothetical protein
MSDTITADLLRAANSLHKIGRSGISDLLYRAIREISDLRVSVGIPGSGTNQDAIIRLLDVAARAEDQSDGDVSSALLEAADMIRTLRVIAGSGIELKLKIRDFSEETASDQ